MESFKRALESIGRMWANLSATQRVILSAAAATMALLLVWSSIGTTQALVRVAGPEVDQTTRGNIIKKFQDRNQKHEVRGTEIFVPKEDADRIVLELAGDGSMKDGAVWKFLEQSDIFATKWEKEKRFQIALQSRLEGMIRSIESVRNASVVINPGSTNYQLGFAGPKPSVSVQVELKEGMTLTRKNVQAIAGLVARAVSGVEDDQVVITDTKANRYRVIKTDQDIISADSLREIENAKEKEIYSQIKDSPFFSGASVVVRAQANSKSTKSEAVTHDRPVVTESTDTKRTVRKGGGSQTGVQKGERDPAVESSSGGEETETTSHDKSVVGSKKTFEDLPAGDIQRITVGVLIPVEEGPRLTEYEKQLQKLRDFVLKAAGPQARMEDVSVQLIPTKRPEPIVAVAESVLAVEWIYAHAAKIALFALAIAGLVILSLVVRGALARDTVEELQGLATALGEEPAAELAVPGEGDVGRLKQGLQEMVGRNPQTVAASLKSFMSGR